MNELQSILHEWHLLGVAADQAVLATVVHVKGSSYRRPGARMLLLPNGRRVGTISGGCLEGDVARKATWWTSEGVGVVRTFDNSAPDVAWEFGLGCNGVISILLERAASPSVRGALAFIDIHQSAGNPCVIATVIRTAPGVPWQIGDRALWAASGETGGALCTSGSELGTAVAEAIRETLAAESGRLLHTPEADVFVEWIGLPQRLVIFGAGHDVIPLSRMASLLGWHVTIADSRPPYAQSERFPGSDQVVPLPPGGGLSGIPIDPLTAVVVMTHNYPQDLLLVPQILAKRPRYVGLLGPRHRTENLFAEANLDLAASGVHAPIGLDLGCDHPETIALSIIAEIQAVVSSRSAGPLRQRPGSMHVPVPECGDAGPPVPCDDEVTTLESCAVIA